MLLEQGCVLSQGGGKRRPMRARVSDGKPQTTSAITATRKTRTSLPPSWKIESISEC